ncbi:hemagglutinin, partial [Pseudomonas aeruginosa]
SQALGQGGSLNEALKSALYNSFAAAGFNFVGDIGQEYSLKPGDPSMVTMHALMGGLAAQVSGGDFATGAAAAGANEALVAKLDQAFKSLSPENREAMVTMGSQLVGVLATAVRDPDATGKALESAAWVAKNSTQYNFLNHQDVADLDNALQKCKSQGNCRQVEEEFKARSDENRRRLNGCVAAGNCAEIRAEIDAGSTALNELVARQETANPGGSDSDIAYGFLMGRNVVDWTTAGQLHLEQTANLWWNGNPQWQKEVGAYLDQTGFNPFGIGVPAMGGAAGKVSAKALMNALKAGELPKGEVAPGKANLPTIGALADAEAG